MTLTMVELADRQGELEAGLGPFGEPEFRAGLTALTASVQQASRQWAADVEVLAALAASVPRHPNDERGGTPWNSFLREVAVARRASVQAAASEVHLACALVGSHPVTLSLLRSGRMPVLRARVLIEECSRWPAPAGGSDGGSVAAAVDAELAEKACALPPWRIRQAVTAIALRRGRPRGRRDLGPHGPQERARARPGRGGADRPGGAAGPLVGRPDRPGPGAQGRRRSAQSRGAAVRPGHQH